MLAYCENNPVTRKDSTGTAYVFLDEFIAEVDPDARYDEGGGGGGLGLGVNPSYYTSQKVQAYDWNWQNSSYNQNPTTSTVTSACFVAGTLIQTDEGTKPIEKIELGNQVWAWDEETGDVALKRVIETYVNETCELIHVFINGEEIVATPEHPFYSRVMGWTAACKLRAGDILVLVNGECVVVEKVQHELLEMPIMVYNFQVEGYHTYYVSNIGVLVHNSCAFPNTTTEWDIHYNSKGQIKVGNTTAQYDGHYYWLRDTAGHGGSAYKVYSKNGKYLYWQYDADIYGNFIYGKHKSEMGIILYIG